MALDLPFKRFVRPIIGPFMAAGVMWLVVRTALSVGGAQVAALAPEHHVTRLLVGAGLGVAVYAALLPLLARTHLSLLFEQFARLRRELRTPGAEPSVTIDPTIGAS